MSGALSNLRTPDAASGGVTNLILHDPVPIYPVGRQRIPRYGIRTPTIVGCGKQPTTGEPVVVVCDLSQ